MTKQILVILFLLILNAASPAQLSPGDLAEVHSFLEGIKNCTQCHEIGEKVSGEKCLDCHNLLRERIQAGLGLHAGKAYLNCKSCHSEHHGREYKLIWWKEGVDHFDHTGTGFALEGKHLQLKCRQCHRSEFIRKKEKFISSKIDPDVTYLGLKTDCLNCHRDEHHGQLNQECLQCHTIDAWKPASLFDHNRSRFILTGKHLEVPCQACHKNVTDDNVKPEETYRRYAGFAFSNCSDCHRDPHSGRLGPACQNCHQTTAWQSKAGSRFDHNSTRFPLTGKHHNVTCVQCHGSNRSISQLKFQKCSDCHRDFHQGQFTTRPTKGACEECHTVAGFSPANYTIEDHNKSAYPLEGAHLAVPCDFCHQNTYNGSPRFKFDSIACTACHRDPHRGETSRFVDAGSGDSEQAACRFCHNLESWQKISFDHTKTGFILLGRHQSALCISCHKKSDATEAAEIIGFRTESKTCQDCHIDIHAGQFADKNSSAQKKPVITRCERCHSPEVWQASLFDHNRDSAFKLDGAHEKVACIDCHQFEIIGGEKTRRYRPLDTTCKSCHAEQKKLPGGNNL
jgi:hypothetical protein